MEDALRLGSKAMGVQRDMVAVLSEQRLPSGITKYQLAVKSDNLGDSIEHYLDVMEQQMQDLDVAGIVKGMTSEEMQSKGILSTDVTEDDHRKRHSERTVGPLQFCDGIEYLQCDSILTQDEHWMNHLETSTPVVPAKAPLVRVKGIAKADVSKRLIDPSDKNLTLTQTTKDFVEISAAIPGRLLLCKDRLCFIARDINCEFVLHSIPDTMLATADILPAYGDGKMLSIGDVLDQLKARGVLFGLKSQAIESALAKCSAEHCKIENLCVARGMPPIKGTDAKVETFFSDEVGCEDFSILPDGKIDYHRKVVIPMAHKGDLLARISLPSAGQAGMDIFGNMITPATGSSHPLFAGEGAQANADGREFIALRDGQICMNLDTISVLPTYQVIGNVDYHCGNIEFDGNILITGSILSGFTVRAKGDILVNGNIEAATVETGRDLIVKGGIIGSTQIPIKIGRHLVAHHLQNANVEVEGNVHIMHSCLHSQVETSGEFQCVEQKGTLLGGTLITLRGAEVRHLGSDAGTSTRLILGQDFLVRKKIKEAQEALDFVNAGLLKIENYLTPLLALLNQQKISPAPEQIQRLKVVVDRRKELLGRKELLLTRIHRLDRSSNLITGVKLKVLGTLFPDVKVQIGGAFWQPESESTSLEVTLDPVTNRVRVVHVHTR